MYICNTSIILYHAALVTNITKASLDTFQNTKMAKSNKMVKDIHLVHVHMKTTEKLCDKNPFVVNGHLFTCHSSSWSQLFVGEYPLLYILV